jgi:hypothetical protein
MIAVLARHELAASAPSWDGKWLSILLRAAGLPRHSLRLRDTDEVRRDTARTILKDCVAADRLDTEIKALTTSLAAGWRRGTPVHRALADAEEERRRWLDTGKAAQRRRVRFESDTNPASIIAPVR